VQEWRSEWNRRLRPFLISQHARDLYRSVAAHGGALRLGDLANVGIGYVSGANDFFHLRPSEAARWDIPATLLHPSVCNGRALPPSRVTTSVVARWRRDDEPILLLKLPKVHELPRAVSRYLDTDAGRAAREAYKCRVRDPWYSVPDVQVPDFFLSYMSGREPSLVRNDAHCTCTNSVHSVPLKGAGAKRHLASWGSEFVQLSCELEGHPLGGGMLKLEPREATQIVLPALAAMKRMSGAVIADAIQTMRSWRHYGEA
jgi:adenine-specific DNA-methyltransferase